MKHTLPKANTMVILRTFIQKENQEEINHWGGCGFVEFNLCNVFWNYSSVLKQMVRQVLRETVKTYSRAISHPKLHIHQE